MTDDTTARQPTIIDAIAEAWVDTELDLYPEARVYLGRPGREGEYADYSPAGAEEAMVHTRRALAEIEAAIPKDDVDRITQMDLARDLRLTIDKHEAGFGQRDLNVIASPAQELREIFDLMPTDTVDDWANVATRMHNLPAAMDGYIESLRSGIAAGNVPAIRQITEVAAQARKHVAGTGFFFQLAQNARAGGVELPGSVAGDLDAGARESAAAYARLAEFLGAELAQHAPQKDAVGRELYALASRGFLGATVDLDETYEWGIDELARMVAEQESIAREIKPGASVEEAVEFLDGDQSRKLHGTDALQRWMQETSDRAVDELSRSHFDIPEPVKRLECMIADPGGRHLLHEPDRRLLPAGPDVVERAGRCHRVRHLA